MRGEGTTLRVSTTVVATPLLPFDASDLCSRSLPGV